MNLKRMIWLGITFTCLSQPSSWVLGAVTDSQVHFPASAMMGEETIGNEPFHDANFQDWPNIMPVINNQSRVYHTWVNGDERFYFDSDPEQDERIAH